MYICFIMYPVQMPSLMYLTFSKKQRITFCLPTRQAGWVKTFSPWLYYILQVTEPPFMVLSEKTGFCQDGSHRFIFIALHILMSSVSAAFSRTNKMYFACSKETLLELNLYTFNLKVIITLSTTLTATSWKFYWQSLLFWLFDGILWCAFTLVLFLWYTACQTLNAVCL